MNREEEIRKAKERIRTRYENRDNSSSSSRPNILDFDKIGGFKKELIYKLKEGANNLDILPYKIKTKKHKDVHEGKMEIGDTDYVLNVSVHKDIGVRKGTYICLERMYGMECPICEDRKIRYKDETEDKDELNKLFPQERVIYNVLNVDADGEPEVQLLEMSYSKFEKPLREQAGVGGEVVVFHDHEIGKTVQVRGSASSFINKQGQKVNFVDPSRFDFVNRDPYPANITDHTYPLDEMLIVPTAEELRNVHYRTTGPEQTPIQEEGKEKGPAQAEAKSDSPFAGRAKSTSEDSSEQPLQRERHRERSVKTDEECPFGHKFGHEIEKHKDCNKCDDKIWRACSTKADELGV